MFSAEQLLCIRCGDRGQFKRVRTPKLSGSGNHVYQESGLVGGGSSRHRCLIWCISLDEQPISRHALDGLSHPSMMGIGDGSTEAEVKSEVEIHRHLLS